MLVPLIVILPGLLGLGLLPEKLVAGIHGGSDGGAQLQRRAPADACALLRTWIAWAWHHDALIAGFMSGIGGKRNCIYGRLFGTYDIYRALGSHSKGAAIATYVVWAAGRR